jgi:hypothetical protein
MQFVPSIYYVPHETIKTNKRQIKKHCFLYLSINRSWIYSPLFDLGRFFSFLIFYTVGRTP